MIKCERCKNEKCDPEQVPGSKTPCLTCGQPYGEHCYSRHAATQFCFNEKERQKLMLENLAMCGELPPPDVRRADELEAILKVGARYGINPPPKVRAK